MVNDRLESALLWCEKHKLKTKLDLNDLQSERKPVKKKKKRKKRASRNPLELSL